ILAGFSKKLTSACSLTVQSSSASELLSPDPAGFVSSGLVTSDLWASPRWPASPICSTRLVTLAMDSVLQNWMNSFCTKKTQNNNEFKNFIALSRLGIFENAFTQEVKQEGQSQSGHRTQYAV
uniref:Uncharacterized protein n=1 Tax=Oryzias melastigma TaxID=30732 RepID=A0A3B3DSB7_ORYME